MEFKPCGSWDSPISSSQIVESAVRFVDLAPDEADLYWSESRPEEKGRTTIVKNGEDILSSPFNARNKVHEYGGASFTASNGLVYFVNFEDQGLYALKPGASPQKIYQKDGFRFATPLHDPKRDCIYAVMEGHLPSGKVLNSLARIKDGVKPLHEGEDFYSMPALSPDGSSIAFITWNLPNMPWDGSSLWVGKLDDDGLLKDVKKIAGSKDESIFQPLWSPDGILHFVSDQTNWWNLYRYVDGKVQEVLPPIEAEFGQPLWVFNMSNYGFLEDGKIACFYTIKGIDHVGMIDPISSSLEKLDIPFTSISSFKVSKDSLMFFGASPTKVQTLISYHVPKKRLKEIKSSKKVHLDKEDISIPQTIEFPTKDGKTAYGFYYPPKNRNFEGTDLPPLIVKSHGGPTARAHGVLNLETQFWTSRGIAVLDVNYGGSTGYGREYRERLTKSWGTVDVDDCCNGALFLAESGFVDKNRMAIKGGSAGGYTTLAALTFLDVFSAGASYYGVSDLKALAADTHKFESRYLDKLIGPYPEEEKLYEELSPICHVDQLSCPVILLQGEEDKVVPPSQAEMMFEALKNKKIPVSYLLFKNEQHGFRQAENIVKALDAELYFYSKVFQFELAKPVTPITIHNIP